MKKQISTGAFVLIVVFASALSAQPVEAAGLFTPSSVNSYLGSAIKFVATLFQLSPASVEAQPAAAAAGQGNITPRHISALSSGSIPLPSSAGIPLSSSKSIFPPISTHALISTPTGAVTQSQLRKSLDQLAFALTSALAASRSASLLTGAGGYSETATPSNSGQTLKNLTVAGVTGLAASDIPDLSGKYVSVGGGGTIAGLTNFTNASTTLLSVNGSAYFGATATSTFGSDGSLTLAKALGVGSGGTGWTNINSGSILFGNGASALATSSSLFWDNTHGRLGIGTTSPAATLDVNGGLHWWGESYYDNTDGFTERNAAWNVVRSIATPSGVQPTLWVQSIGLGNNSTFQGVSNGYFQAIDNSSVTNSTKGVLYGLQISIRPLVARNNSPYDDATGLVIQNDAPGQYIATDAFYLGHNSLFTSGAKEWQTGFLDGANTNSAFAVASGTTVGTGLDLCWGGCATVTTGVRVPNSIPAIVGRNAAGTGDVEIGRVNGANNVVLGSSITINPSTGTSTFNGSASPLSDLGASLGGVSDRWGTIFAKSFVSDNGSHNWSVASNIGSSGDGNLSIAHDGNTYLTILNSGNVGIGTTSPATTLSVAGNLYATGGLGIGVENTTGGTLQTSGNANVGGTLTVGGTSAAFLGQTVNAFGGLQFGIAAGSLSAPGGTMSGYNAGDTATVQCTGVSFSVNPIVGITAVSGGAVTGYTLSQPGVTSGAVPSGSISCSQSSTSGSGTGLTFTASLGVIASYLSIPALATGGAANNGNLLINNAGIDTPNSTFAGSESTFFGDKAGSGITGGAQAVTAVGHNACGSGGSGTSQSNLVCIGTDAGRNIQGNVAGSVVIGAGAGRNLTGGNNVIIGSGAAGSNGANSAGAFTGAGEVVIGENAGKSLTTGNFNLVVIGQNVGANTLTSGSNDILIGTQSGVDTPAAGTANFLNIGNLVFGTGLSSNSSISGNVGIGTSTPYSRLTVWGPDTASTTAFAVVNSASTTVFAVYDTGNSTYSGSIFQSSDQRLKTNVSPLTASSSLAAIEQLNPVSYTRLDQPEGGTNLGFLAQQVQPVFPELVSLTTPSALTPGGTLTLNYTGLIAPIVGAIQEIAHDLSALQTTVASFAQSFTTHQLCVADNTGATTCITKGELDALLAGAHITGQAVQPPVAPVSSATTASTTPTTSPIDPSTASSTAAVVSTPPTDQTPSAPPVQNASTSPYGASAGT